MMKLLIVDDEQIEREGLQAIIQKSYPELDIAQAKNGKIALQLADQFKPDLILMDIKMPGMNGLEAVERIQELYPEIKCIMVTAYDTFEYAHQAIKLGVKDYLIKPSKVSEVIATVGRVLGVIREERELLAASRLQQVKLQAALPLVETDVVTQLLFDHVHEVHLGELLGLLDVQATNEKFVMNVTFPPGAEGLYGVIKASVRRTGSGWVGALYGRQLPIIVFRMADRSFRSQAIQLARDILAPARANAGADWFVGIGNPYTSLDHIRQSYQQSLIASMDTSLPVKYRFYADMPCLNPTRDERQDRQREKLFFDQIRLGQWEHIHSYVMDVIQRCECDGAELLHTQQRVLEALWSFSRVLGEMGVDADTPFFSFQSRDYRQLRAESGRLLDMLKQVYAAHQDRLEPDMMIHIKQYITEHSHEDISLDTISKIAGLSPFYISKMFKEQLGVNYIDFLTECRIDNAKKLMMSDLDKSVKEIAFEVGYNDPNYFSKVFKKVCDASPKEYRKTLLGKKADGW